MKISYCTTVSNRLWQLEKTLPTNLGRTLAGEVEICILAYNDATVIPWLHEHYPEYMDDGRIRAKLVVEDKPFSFSHTKNLSHQMALGDIVFNLDADNFICNAHSALLKLKEDEILVQTPNRIFDGRSGRIGCYKQVFDQLGGYDETIIRCTDGDFIKRAAKIGKKLIATNCQTTPIPNTN